jgi:uncharacterized protein DUF4352
MSFDQQPRRRPRTPHGPRPVRRTRSRARFGPVLCVVAALGTLIVLFGVGAAAENRGRGGSPAAVNRPAGRGIVPITTAAKKPGLGDPVRDGKFEFVASRVDCSHSTVGFEHLRRTAVGRYCVISLSIRNIDDRPGIFVGRLQKVSDAAGTEFSNDELAGLLANRETQTSLRKIGPGGKVSGKIVFDVPRGTALTTMELHDSYFSGGVRIALP